MVKAGGVVVALPADLFQKKYLTPNASNALTDFYPSAPASNKKKIFIPTTRRRIKIAHVKRYLKIYYLQLIYLRLIYRKVFDN